jgi:hypothetical protein
MATTIQETGRHVALVEIRVPENVRALDPEHVEALAGSIKLPGMLVHPPVAARTSPPGSCSAGGTPPTSTSRRWARATSASTGVARRLARDAPKRFRAGPSSPSTFALPQTAQGFFVITLPAGEITYQRPPLTFRACPVACPGDVSVT